MKKELLNVLENLTEENIEKFVDQEIKKNFSDCFSGDSSSHFALYINTVGDYWIGDYSSNSEPISSFKGDSICLWSQGKSLTLEENWFLIEDLTEEEIKKILEEKEYNNIEDIKEYDIICYLKDNNIDKYTQIEAEAIESDWCNYYRDLYIDSIETAVKELLLLNK